MKYLQKLLQAIYLLCNTALLCSLLSQSQSHQHFISSHFVVINIFCGFRQIVIWTQLSVARGQFGHTTQANNDSVYLCTCVLSLNCVCMCACILFSHLVIPIHSTGFSFIDTSWADRPCCLHVSLTQGAKTQGNAHRSSPVQSDGKLWNMRWCPGISGNKFKDKKFKSCQQ